MRPASSFLNFVEARYLYGTAWNVHGSGYARSVPEEAWQIYHKRMRQAEELLLNAKAPLKGSPMWYNLLLSLSLDSNQTQSDAIDVFTRAVAAWPQY